MNKNKKAAVESVIDEIIEAWQSSTRNHNNFRACLESIEWVDTFRADGEFYFEGKGFLLVVKCLDPFAKCDKPVFIFDKGCPLDINGQRIAA